MVKFFESKDKWGGVKWNWVSDTDRFIGFDANECCCEAFDYYYTKKVNGKETKYLYKTVHKKLESGDNDFELGDVIIKEKGDSSFGDNYAYIELLNKKSNDLVCYIVLYNSHNGYYGHGLRYKTIDGVEYEDVL